MAASLAKVSCVCGKRSLILPHKLFYRSLSSIVAQEGQQVGVELPPQDESQITIKIPKRKKRDSLSILKALAATVQRDDTAPQYKYLDDPYLSPVAGIEKKTFALAKASGQRAARYMIETYPHLFEPSKAEPHIEAFQPKSKPFTHAETTEQGLQERIDRRQCLAAYESFQKIREEGGSISQSTYSELLDLLCCYNSQDPPSDLLPDELFYRRDVLPSDNKQENAWQEGSAAEMVFNDMEEKSACAYNSMVRGMAKYNMGVKAREMYQEMREKSITVDLGTYNELLLSVTNHSFQPHEKWPIVESLLKDMSNSGVTPNLATFNAALTVLSKIDRRKNSAVKALGVIKEMMALGIEPSLASWNSVLRVFYSNDDTRHDIIYDVIDYMKGKEYTLQDPNDSNFFITAMIKSHTNLKDLSLAHRVNDLLHTGSNLMFMGDSSMQNLYYSHYIQLISTFDELSSVMSFYEKNVPHLWVPNYKDILTLLRTIELNEGYEYLPQFWSDILLIRYAKHSAIVESFVHIMAKKKHSPELQDRFVTVTEAIRDIINEQADMPKPLQRIDLSGNMLGNLALINLHADKLKEAWSHFTRYYEKKNIMKGFPSEEALEVLTRKCLQAEWIKEAITTVSLMADLAYPKVDQLIKEIGDHPKLTDAQREEIAAL